MALKATDEPMLIKPRSMDTIADTAMEFTGSLLRDSTFARRQQSPQRARFPDSTS